VRRRCGLLSDCIDHLLLLLLCRFWRAICQYGARCKWFAYGPADATAIPFISCVIKIQNPNLFILSSVGFGYWKRGCIKQAFFLSVCLSIAVQVKKEFSFSLFDLDWEVFGVNIEGAINRVPAIEKTGVKSTVCGPGASIVLFSSIYIQRWTVFGRPFTKRFALCYRSVVCSVCLSVCLSCLWRSCTLIQFHIRRWTVV